MMNDIKKNELNETEMNEVIGGWFHSPEIEQGACQTLEAAVDGICDAGNAVADAVGTAYQVVKYVLFG